jgi:hypothetical protein
VALPSPKTTGGGCDAFVRRTDKLEQSTKSGLAEKAPEILGRTQRHVETRAASGSLLADSRASFEIEGEQPPRDRLERWGKAEVQAGTASQPIKRDVLNARRTRASTCLTPATNLSVWGLGRRGRSIRRVPSRRQQVTICGRSNVFPDSQQGENS